MTSFLFSGHTVKMVNMYEKSFLTLWPDCQNASCANRITIVFCTPPAFNYTLLLGSIPCPADVCDRFRAIAAMIRCRMIQWDTSVVCSREKRKRFGSDVLEEIPTRPCSSCLLLLYGQIATYNRTFSRVPPRSFYFIVHLFRNNTVYWQLELTAGIRDSLALV